MRIRSLAIVVASLSLVTVGCATKKFVREEVSKSEAKLGADVGKVDSALTEEKARTTALNDQLGQTKVAVQQADKTATEATGLAKAALAAHRQGKYLAFHKALMQVRGTADEAQALDVAAKTGVDVERMKADMNDPAFQAAIDKNLELAQALRINGTPGFVIGKQILRGATDLKTLQALIGEARNAQN